MTRLLPASISAVLPAYNEEAVIADVVRRTHRALTDSGVGDFEVVVVDDGSKDRTSERIAEVAADHARIRVVRHPVNRGYGAALRTGFESATCDVVWLLDSDGQFDPADLRDLLRVWEGGALVAGFRLERRDTLMRKLNHDAFFALVRLLMGPTVKDVNCAFKLFPRNCGVGLKCDGAVISTELVLRARQRGVHIVEVGVVHHPRIAGKATGARASVVARAFGELIRLRAAHNAVAPPEPDAEIRTDA